MAVMNESARNPQTIRSAMRVILTFSAIKTAIVISLLISAMLTPSDFSYEWFSFLTRSLGESVWAFLGVAGAIIIALQIAVRDEIALNSRPSGGIRRQVLALASMIIGSFVLDVVILATVASFTEVSVPLVFAAGGSLVFLAAEAGSALEVPSKDLVNLERLDRYTTASRRLTVSASAASVTRRPGLASLFGAGAVTFGVAYAPAALLWFIPYSSSFMWQILALLLAVTLVMLLTATFALWLFAPGLTLETRAILCLAFALTALLVFISGEAVWQTADFGYIAGFAWLMIIVAFSAVGKPRRLQVIQTWALRSALRRQYIAWLGARILRLRALTADARPLEPEELDIENLRAWLVSAVPNVGGTGGGFR
jgi:hypothetical protein